MLENEENYHFYIFGRLLCKQEKLTGESSCLIIN